MKTQLISLGPKPPGLFVAQCTPCPRAPWCQKSAEQQCLIPEARAEQDPYWASQRRQVLEVGGMEPRPLPPLLLQPRLAKVTHIIGHSDRINPPELEPTSLGVKAGDVLGPIEDGFCVRHDKLARRGLLDLQKVLVITAEDNWLRRFTRHVGPAFAESLLWLDFAAVMGPNLSGYHHSDHSVWLDNRAICQQFMDFALGRGLPAIFHTYLEDSSVHQDWLVEYLKLNPSQMFIATGFDCNGTSNEPFVKRRIQLLSEVESRVGRKLHIVLHTLLTKIRLIKYAHDAFPRRVYLLGGSVVRDSYYGTSLRFSPDGPSIRNYGDPAYKPGMALFNENARRLEEALGEFVPGFFDAPHAESMN